MEASSALMSLGFFGLLRNLRPATRTGPDLGELFFQLGCSRCFGNGGVIRHGVQRQTSTRNRPNLDAVPASEMTASAVKMARSAIA